MEIANYVPNIFVCGVLIIALYYFYHAWPVRGVAELSPMIDVDGVVLKKVSSEIKSETSTYDTGSFTTYHSGSSSTSYKNTSSYTKRYYFIKFILQNTNNYPVDILIKFRPYDQIIRHKDGTYKETRRDAPQCQLLNLPAKEIGKTLLSLDDTGRLSRPIHLESISVRITKTTVWQERKTDLLVKK